MMKFSGYRPLLSAIFGSLLGLALATAPASAAIVMLNSGDIIPGTVWSVSFPASVTLSFNDADTTNRTAGTLIESTSRTINDAYSPITLLFQQMFETPTSSVGGGLRLNFQKTDKNVVGPDWTGYNLQLFDDFPAPNDPRSGDHPPAPHFHPGKLAPDASATFKFGETFTGDKTVKYRSSFEGDMDSRDPADFIQLGFPEDPNGKTVAKDDSMQIQNLLIHEREFAPGVIGDPGRRTFRLVETPIIPEPGSLGLCGIALTMLGSYSWLWRRRASTSVG